MSAVNYIISIENPVTHLFSIKINYNPSTPKFDELYMPNWIPGSYMIRDFAKHVLDVKAFDENGSLDINFVSKNTLKLTHNQRPVTVEYKYYAFDLSVRKAYLDQEYGFINPASSCFTVKGLEQLKCNVTLSKQQNPSTKNWTPATGLDKANQTDDFSWGDYRADNYLAFTDYPILFGELDIAKFTINDIPHYVITVGQHFGDLQRVARDLTPICQYQADMFDGLPDDVEQYLFLTMITDNGFGGLEHLNSTALVASRFDIASSEQEISDGYQTFLSLCSHEYLHTWNVKRLKPKEFIPYQLDQEVYTTQLWFYEGMTSYFDDLSLVATNTISIETYLNGLAKTLTRIERGEGQLRQSVTESSLLTWTKFYQQDDTAPDQIVSYYLKGAAMACFADLAIRQQSNNEQCLKQVMATAWNKFGVTNLGTSQQDLESLFHTFMSEAHYQQFLSMLYNKEKIDLKDVFNSVGLKLSYQSQNKSGQWFNETKSTNVDGDKQTKAAAPNYWIGATLAKINGEIVVKQVMENSPAQLAGIATGDVLVAFNSLKINTESIEALVKNAAIDKGNKIHYFRKDRLLHADIEMRTSADFVAGFSIVDREKVRAWLS